MNTASSIRNSGLKATLPRLKILEIFEQNREKHLSAEDIYKILLQENVEIGPLQYIEFLHNLKHLFSLNTILKWERPFSN